MLTDAGAGAGARLGLGRYSCTAPTHASCCEVHGTGVSRKLFAFCWFLPISSVFGSFRGKGGRSEREEEREREGRKGMKEREGNEREEK